MRVLAVAEHLLPARKPRVQRGRESGPSRGFDAGEEVGNRAIVDGRVGEGLRRPASAAVQRRAAAGLDLARISAYCRASVAMVVKAWFLAAARTIVGPPISICSIASSSVTPGLRTVASNG